MNPITPIKIGSVLSVLMSKHNVSDLELAQKTGIPLPTIARLRRGKDVNPTAATLRPLADFFTITVGQLLGDEILPPTLQPYPLLRVPILDFAHIEKWQTAKNIPDDIHDWIPIQQSCSTKTFAIVINTASSNVLFQKGSLLVIDPVAAAFDGDFVLVKETNEAQFAIKQLLVDGKEKYLKSTNPELNSIRIMTPEDEISGVVIEARHAFK